MPRFLCSILYLGFTQRLPSFYFGVSIIVRFRFDVTLQLSSSSTSLKPTCEVIVVAFETSRDLYIRSVADDPVFDSLKRDMRKFYADNSSDRRVQIYVSNHYMNLPLHATWIASPSQAVFKYFLVFQFADFGEKIGTASALVTCCSSGCSEHSLTVLKLHPRWSCFSCPVPRLRQRRRARNQSTNGGPDVPFL